MAKAKDRKKVDSLYATVAEMSALAGQRQREWAEPDALAWRLPMDSSKTPRMKKFRFQLLHQWLTHRFAPCRAADIGGGKGLLTYLLRKDGWDARVVDPQSQPLLEKYKDIVTERQTAVPPGSKVPRIDARFEQEMAEGFDLLIGLHAHGCNMKIIDAAARYGTGFLLLPCCVIDEPLHPLAQVNWVECLADYAIQQGHVIYPLQLNFKGQNIGFYALGNRVKMRDEQRN
jgi:hypothetical protein